tara:strand:+ start:657 stop:1493 length:837 start_codon:yes stop_codon:yes gene_type:complete
MAETLTYDPGTDTVTEGDALTPAEQESLEVGEALEQSQDQLLAGKYKDAQELEKAYVELQKKLGGEDNKDSGEAGESESTTEVESEETTEETEEASQPTAAAELITSASDEYYNNDGKLSPETLEKFSSMSSKELVEAYMQVQNNLPQGDLLDKSADISDAAVNEVKNYAGGEKAYTDMVNWASQNLDQQSIDAFDNIINTGSIDAIKFAVNGLKSQYREANGFEGTMVTGKAPVQTQDVYRSQQELVAAMSDRRYDNDPAYRQDVIAKLERSDNLQF